MKIMPLLLIDYYKATHHEQYPKGLTKMVSYFTPRMSRMEGVDEVICIGIQGFIQEYLIEMFNGQFFRRPKGEVLMEYWQTLNATLGEDTYDLQKVADLHDLGYLPLEIRAIPEGTIVPIKVPIIEISNTHPDFVWLVNTIETMMSCSLWHMMISASIGYMYRQVVNEVYEKTVVGAEAKNALGDFSMRGQESVESAIRSSAAFLLSFMNTATVPAILWLDRYYNPDGRKLGTIGRGAISTEHSVMCSNYAIDGDEITFIRRLLTEIYPKNNFSMVSDSYDYWNLVTKILPQLRSEIEAHEGVLSIRGDSGDPIEIIAGREIVQVTKESLGRLPDAESDIEEQLAFFFFRKYAEDMSIEEDTEIIAEYEGRHYLVNIITCYTTERGAYTDNKYWFLEEYEVAVKEHTLTPEDKGTVACLYETFGGTINSKGYKTLNPKIKAIYGDGITLVRAKAIYERLEKKGFAANCVTLGVGSFSMQCIAEGDHYNPFTRDTFGIAVKATYCEDAEGKPINIYKNPKTDKDNFKKSQKGCCIVRKDDRGITYTDEHTWQDSSAALTNLLRPIFRDGRMIKDDTIADIRARLHKGEF